MEKIKDFIKKLGPGIITGASDDDPSGILTYLQTGAVIGFNALWTVLVSLPFMYFVQEMCARIGLVTDKGLIKLIKENFSKYILYPIAFISVLVMTINIGADLLAISSVLNTFLKFGKIPLLFLTTIVILAGTVFFSYHRFARVLKWLTLSLLFYVAAVFYMNIEWAGALKATFFPAASSFSAENLLLIAAVFGTTISPYLFFWQASEETEEIANEIKSRHLKKFIVTKHELKMAKEDVFSGMLFSNLVMWFIIAGAAGLSVGGEGLATFEQAAAVLAPAVGQFAFLIFALGLLGTGLLAIPVLGGSVGYILAEIFNWNEGIDKTFRQARGFYLSIMAATVIGMLIVIFNFDPIKMLIYTALFYAVITPPLIFLILKIANNGKIMGERTNSKISNFFGILTLLTMAAAALIFIVSLF